MISKKSEIHYHTFAFEWRFFKLILSKMTWYVRQYNKYNFSSLNLHIQSLTLLKSAKRPDWDYLLGSNTLQESNKEKDLGVIINSKLSPEDHINDKVRNTYNLLANMSGLCIYRRGNG